MGNYADVGFKNVYNNMSEIFDENWFDVTNNDDMYTYYEGFCEDFANWLRTQGVDIDEYRNMPLDIGYYFKQYMEDDNADHFNIETVFEAVHNWVQSEDDFASSDDYLDDMYCRDARITDLSFYADPNVIERSARQCMEDGVNRGFNSAEDIVTAVNAAIDDYDVEDIEDYDAGGYGYIKWEPSDDMFLTGTCWLGNGEEEWQMQDSVPFAEEYDYGNVYRDFTIHGDCIYTISDKMYEYGIAWDKIEEKGRELGLIQ